MSAADPIAAILRQHRGRDRAISAREIARQLGWSDGQRREVRRIIEEEDWEAREMPVMACSTGFYLAATVEEFQHRRNWLAALFAKAKQKLADFDTMTRRNGIHLEKSK